MKILLYILAYVVGLILCAYLRPGSGYSRDR